MTTSHANGASASTVRENDWARWAGFVAVASMPAFMALVFQAAQNITDYRETNW